MCKSNFSQDEPQKPKPAHLNICDIKTLEKSTQDYMSRISEVKIEDMYSSSPEVFVDAFRDGFQFAEHNFLENGNGILCYDLMICQNPLDEQKKQLFYTFFSQESVYDKKLRLAKIYQYYLDFYPEYHIDTMLQICYTENCNDVKEGFCLKFEEKGCKMISLGNSIQNSKELKSFELNGNRLIDCEPYIPTMSNIDEEGVIKTVIGEFEEYIDENTKQTADEKSEYADLVSAFLDIKTPISEDKDRNVSFKQIHNNVYRISLINELAVPGIKCLYFIPISFPNHKQIGHFVLSTDGKDLKRDREWIEKFKVLSFILMFPLSQANVSSIFMKKAYVESVKSAKAAIMSRNMSHNLGSHVMSYLKQNLSSVKDMLNNRIFSLLFESEEDMLQKLSQEIKTEIENSDTVALPFLVGLGQFISYLQERQDFIATISTDFIPYYSNVNFKDFIYDELNPDKRYERHKDRANLKIDNILLGNIARSEGLGRPISPTKNSSGDSDLGDIVIKFRDFDGNPVEGVGIDGKAVDDNDPNIINSKKSLDQMRQYDVSLPGGVVGRQAVFSIVENVIRNAAKHGNWRDKKKLELTIDIYKKDDFIEVEKEGNNILCRKLSGDNVEEIKDDKFNSGHLSLSEVIKEFYLTAQDANDIYIVTLTDNLSFDENGLARLRTAIAEKYVNERGEMNEANKGIKEMRISATWLRSITDEEKKRPIIPENKDSSLTKEEEYQNKKKALTHDRCWKVPDGNHVAPILYARISNGHLQYIFCLMRPRKVAIISPRFKGGNNYNISKFVEFSWGAYTPDEYLDLQNKSYEFILYDDYTTSEGTSKTYDDIKVCTSSRLLKLSKVCGKYRIPQKEVFFDFISNSLEEDNASAILTDLYKYISNYGKSDDIAIHDEKAWKNILVKENYESETIIKEGIVNICKSGGVFSPYIYRTHYETDENFNFVINNAGIGCVYYGNKFIEGITGNNSTDRLVRNEVVNDLWSFKHLHAMKEKIAILDERIFSKVYGKEESDFILTEENKIRIAKRKATDYFKSLFAKYERHNIDKRILDNIEELISGISEVDTLDDLKEIIYENRDGIKVDEEKNKELKNEDIPLDEFYDFTVVSDSYLGTANAQKGISIYTLIQDEDNKASFKLCGLRWHRANDVVSTLRRKEIRNDKGEVKKDKEGNIVYKSYSICEVIAKLSWDKKNSQNPLIVTPCGETPDTMYKGVFDRISIHQGLLDKLYEGFMIKNSPSDKERLTKGLYDILSINVNEAINYKYKDGSLKTSHWFLPGMTIHSGRSKPGKDDMPQRLPFIQYAAIEHAVFDCKYSLVELLDFARYE